MKCEYCHGRVKVVDEWKGWQTVQCLQCGVRYDARREKPIEKYDFKKMMSQRWSY